MSIHAIQSSTQKVIPTTGQTVSISNSLGNIMFLIQPVASLAAITISFPANPVEAQEIRIFASQNIDSVTLTGGSFDRVPSFITKYQIMAYMWDSTNSIWMLYRDSSSNANSTMVYDITLTGGTFTKYLTVDGLSTGTALFPNFKTAFAVTNDDGFNDSAKVVMSNSNKTATITAKRLTFSGITVVGIAVLGSTSMVAVPNGTVVKLIVIYE